MEKLLSLGFNVIAQCGNGKVQDWDYAIVIPSGKGIVADQTRLTIYFPCSLP